MAIETSSSIGYILKRQYPTPEIMEFAAFRNKPFLAMLPKKYKQGGETTIVPVTTSLGAGFSNTFSNAQTNANIQKGVAYSLGFFPKVYNVQQIDNQLMMNAQNKSQSFIDLVSNYAKTLVETVSLNVARQLYRSGTGSIGRRASVSGQTITLTVADDAMNFYPGLALRASAADGGALRLGTVATVTGVDYSSGTVTVDAVANITAFADNDFLYIDGCAANGGANVALTGLAGWIPSTTPSATTFFGVDRTAAVELLAGTRFDGSALNILDALIQGLNRVARFGTSPKKVFMNFSDYTGLLLVAGDKLRLVNVGTQNAKLNFSGAMISFAGGDVEVVPDSSCPKGLAYIINPETWKLYVSHDMFPNVFTEAGDNKLTMATADAVEIRSNNYMQLACERPVENGVVILPAV